MVFHEVPSEHIIITPSLQYIIEEWDKVYKEHVGCTVKRGFYAMEEGDIFKYCLRGFDGDVLSLAHVNKDEWPFAGDCYVIWYIDELDFRHFKCSNDELEFLLRESLFLTPLNPIDKYRAINIFI